MQQIISSSIEQTKNIGYQLAPYLKKGDLIVLSGDLGAGKTVFVSGILSYFGKENEISSPTFTIVNQYDLTKNLKLFHLDVYRFDFEEEFTAIGGEEFLNTGICIIEWGEKIQNLLPSSYLKLSIEKGNSPEERKIQLIPYGEHYHEILKEAFQN